MYLSEYLFDKVLREKKIEHKWQFAKPGKKIGCDVIIYCSNKRQMRIEVKESQPGRQILYQKNKIKEQPKERMCHRFCLHKHGIREVVDFYVVLAEMDFYIIPSFIFENRSNNLNMKEGKFKTLFFCYKNNFDILFKDIEELKSIYPRL